MPRSKKFSSRINNLIRHSKSRYGRQIRSNANVNNTKTTPFITESELARKTQIKLPRLTKLSCHDISGFTLVPSNYCLPWTFYNFTQKRYYKCSGEVNNSVGEGPSVAIIGAGVAGLSAANHLISNGVTNIHIFEATARLGGRVNTARFLSGGTCELGAEWLAGGDMSNGLIALANQEGLTTNADLRYDRQIICLLSDGKALSSDLCYIGRKIFNRIREETFRIYKRAGDIKHGTVAYYMNRRINEELSHYSDNWTDSLKRLMCALKNDLRIRYGTELSMMSSDTIGSSSEKPGNAIRLKGGLVNALLPLVRDIPTSKIHLVTPIKTVLWGSDRVSVVLEDNSKVQVDYVIVTVPLGYLKKNHETFFYPKLPAHKVDAIEKLGVGNVTKIFMKYPMELWGSKRIEISTLWKTRDWSERESYWFKGVSCVSVQRDIAAVTLGGPEAVYAESETVDALARDLTAMLRCFTNSSFLPLPTEILRSRYNTDDWFNGSGCYLSMNAEPSHLLDFAQPLQEESGRGKRGKNPNKGENLRVLFAGEATYTDNINTVQGARKSGIREAQRIIDTICLPSEIPFKFKKKTCSR